MLMTETSIRDYTTGTPRRHHSLYVEDGNLVLQVIDLGYLDQYDSS
jgi:hypothetical protein